MKKLCIFSAIMLVVTLVFAHEMYFTTATKSVNKEINLSLQSNSNYASSAYDSSMAQVAVTITKISGNHTSVVLSKTFGALQLSAYKTIGSKQTIKIPHVKDDKEYLVITYTITYNTKGSIITFEKSDVMNKGMNTKSVDIEI